MTIATLNIPQNWQLLTGDAMKRFLDMIYGDGVDRDIVAVAHPKDIDDGSIFAQLEYQNIGHILVDESSKVNVSYVREKYIDDLRILNSENGLGSSESIKFNKFVIPPVFDFSSKTLSYGIELYFGTNPAVNLYQIKLLKSGVLTLTIVGNYASQISLSGWEIIPDSEIGYHKYNPSKDMKAESNLDNLILINRFI